MKKRPEEIYVEAQKNSGIERGDKVKIINKAESLSQGWQNQWVKEMDGFIGKIGTVANTPSEYGVLVQLGSSEYHRSFTFPYFVLEKINDE